MREKFINELNKLNTDLINMGSMCEEAINCVKNQIEIGVFVQELYNKCSDLEKKTDTKEKEIESACLKLIFSQQPVASDLRLISAVLKMVSDLERIGDQTFDIIDLFKDFTSATMIRDTRLKDMCEVVTTMVKDSVDSFVKKDVALAQAVLDRDQKVNDIFSDVKDEVVSFIVKNEGEGESIVDILMIAKYLERIGDHSTNIAESVIFAVEG